MSLRCLLMCFFLFVRTSKGIFLKNCTEETQHILIITSEKLLSIPQENMINDLLKRFHSDINTSSHRVKVTCRLHYDNWFDMCPNICKGRESEYNLLFDTSCLPSYSLKRVTDTRDCNGEGFRSPFYFHCFVKEVYTNVWLNSLRDIKTITILTDPDTSSKDNFAQIVLLSQHTFILSDNLNYREFNSQQVTWIDTTSHTSLHDAMACIDCRQSLTPLIDDNTDAASSCYFVVHENHDEVNFKDAGQKCTSKGANMVSIETEEEFHFVQNFLKKTLNVAGLQNRCKQNNSVCLALSLTRHGRHFRWGQGRPLVISPPWSSSLEERGDCVMWVVSRDKTEQRGTWRQVDCNDRDRYSVICEVETVGKKTPTYIKTLSGLVQSSKDILSVDPYFEDDIFHNWYKETKLSIQRFDCVAFDEYSDSLGYLHVCNSKLDCLRGMKYRMCSVKCNITDKENQSFLKINRNITTNCKTNPSINLESRPGINLTRPLNELCVLQAENNRFENPSNATGSMPGNCTIYSLWPDVLDCKTGIDCVKTVGSYHTMTYDIGPKCLYVECVNNHILGCRFFTHLQNCTTYKCPSGYFKCPLSYCIPWSYTNDNKQDCPHGEDENDLMFKCFNTSQYIFLDNVCDGLKDCPEGDDEVNCHIECPNGVACLTGNAAVSNPTALTSSKVSTEFKMIFNFSNLITLKCNSMNLKSENLRFITISENNTILHAFFKHNLFDKITSTGSFSKMKILQTLDLSYNPRLSTFSLFLPSLESLDLSDTSILQLNNQDFNNMRKLRFLYLIKTKLTSLNFIPNSYTIDSLHIVDTKMENIGTNYFNGLKITNIVSTSNFKLCCPQALGDNIPVDKCTYKDNTLSSCSDLVSDVSQRALLWVIGLLALFGNLFALAYRMIWDRKVLQTVYGQFVANLGISDMIMGFYLIIIGVSDEVYRDNYFVREDEWKSGVVCQVAGFLSTLSSEVTTFFICLITLDRFLTLRFQTGKYRFTTRIKRAFIIISWLLGFSLALVPVLNPEWGIFTSNSMCLAFPLDSNISGGRYYSVALFLGLNFILFLLITVGQVFIFRSLSARRSISTFKTVKQSRRTQDVLVARQLSLVAVTNILAWVPVQVMGCLVLAGLHLDNDVYSWTAVFVLPLNSALNPAVYSFPKLYSMFKSIKNSCCK